MDSLSLCSVEDTSSIRNAEDIKDLVSHAKINEADLVKRTQCIYFSPSLNLNKYKLIEMDDELVKHLENGGKLTIRGSKVDLATICSDDKTYCVKEAEISNSLLILPSLKTYREENANLTHDGSIEMREIVDVQSVYWELKEQSNMKKLPKLRKLLLENPFCGPEKERYDAHVGKKYCLSDLLDEVPASEVQILSALSTMNVCLINGFYRLMHFDYISRLLTEVLNFIEENSWTWRKVDVERTVQTLAELEPEVVLRKWFQLFSFADETSGFVCLNEKKICQIYAEILLSSVEKFSLLDFTEAWQGSVPEGMTCNFSMLSGLAIVVETNVRTPYVQFLPVDSLPDDPSERFDKLFSIQQRWTFKEICPYVEDLCSKKVDVGALLMKFCRCSTIDQTKYYTSKLITYK